MKSFFIFFLAILGSMELQAQWYQVNSNTVETLNDIYFTSNQVGYAIGGSSNSLGNIVILKTTDGGENWSTVFTHNNLILQEVVAYGSTIKCFGSDNTAPITVVSTDNGASWQVNTLTITNSKIYHTIHQGKLYFLKLSSNGQAFDLKKENLNGTTELLLRNNINKLYGISQTQIVCVNSSFNTLYKSDDLGQTWYTLPNFPNNFSGNNSLHAKIKAFNDTIIIRASYNPVTRYSFDNGISWNYYDGGPSLTTIVNSSIIYGIDNCNGMSCISATNDRGQTWTVQKNNIPENLTNIYFYDEMLGFAIGENGSIYKTTNGGGLGFTNPEFKKKIKIYPNPADNTLNIKNNSNLVIQKICLTDMRGRLVKEYPGNTRKIDVSQLVAGNYFLQVYTNLGKTTKKVVIE